METKKEFEDRKAAEKRVSDAKAAKIAADEKASREFGFADRKAAEKKAADNPREYAGTRDYYRGTGPDRYENRGPAEQHLTREEWNDKHGYKSVAKPEADVVYTNWRGAKFTQEEWDANDGRKRLAGDGATVDDRIHADAHVTKEEWDDEHDRLIEAVNVAKQAVWNHRNPVYEVVDDDGDLVVDQTGNVTPKGMKKRAEAAEVEAKKSFRKTSTYEDRSVADKNLTRAEWEAKYTDYKGRTYPGDGWVDDKGVTHPYKK